MTPAERLLAAADLLDKRAAEATPSPWRSRVKGEGEFRFVDLAGNPREGNFRTPDGKGWTEIARGMDGDAGSGPWLSTEDARYIATMHPAVGGGIGGWLRYEAETLAGDPSDYCGERTSGEAECGCWYCGTIDRALLIADLILAGAL